MVVVGGRLHSVGEAIFIAGHYCVGLGLLGLLSVLGDRVGAELEFTHALLVLVQRKIQEILLGRLRLQRGHQTYLLLLALSLSRGLAQHTLVG